MIGLIALDNIGKLKGSTEMQDSNPGTVNASVGGVGYNVALAHQYGLQSQDKVNSMRFVSAVGEDFAGKSILKHVEESNEDASIVVVPGTTAQYTAILSATGELVLACADMAIFESDEIVEHFATEIRNAAPRLIVLDCNLSTKALNRILEVARESDCKVIVEPTSLPKLSKIGQLNSRNLQVFPNNVILLATPTMAELSSIHKSFTEHELFEDYDEWFPLLDSLGVDSQFREKMSARAKKSEALAFLLDRGVLQQSFQLLPYIPNILVKLGEKGVVLVKLNGNITDYRSIPTTSNYCPEFTLTSEGRKIDDKTYGIVVQYFPIPSENELIDIVNVTGAGDSLLGYLTSTLSTSDWLGPEIDSIEQEWAKWEGIHKAQVASGLTLRSESAVSEKIADI